MTDIGEAQLVKTIKAHIAAGEKAKDKADQHFISAGQHLKTLKERGAHKVAGLTWDDYVGSNFTFGRRRADELIQIADGTKTVEGLRSEKAESVQRVRDRQSALRSAEIEPEDTPDDNTPPFLDRVGVGVPSRAIAPVDMPTAEEADESHQNTLYDHACLIVDEEMSGETRQRFFAHMKRKYDANYSQSLSQSRDQGLPA